MSSKHVRGKEVSPPPPEIFPEAFASCRPPLQWTLLYGPQLLNSMSHPAAADFDQLMPLSQWTLEWIKWKHRRCRTTHKMLMPDISIWLESRSGITDLLAFCQLNLQLPSIYIHSRSSVAAAEFLTWRTTLWKLSRSHLLSKMILKVWSDPPNCPAAHSSSASSSARRLKMHTQELLTRTMDTELHSPDRLIKLRTRTEWYLQIRRIWLHSHAYGAGSQVNIQLLSLYAFRNFNEQVDIGQRLLPFVHCSIISPKGMTHRIAMDCILALYLY